MSELTETTKPYEDAESFAELLRIGKDEMNLAEFPMTSLSDRPVKGETSLKFEDQIFDERKKKIVVRRRIIEGSKEYGLPTATDDSVMLALIQLTKLKNGFTAREVHFTRHELIDLLGWPNKGQSYERVAQSLHRVAGVTYHFENSWWDNRRKAWTTKIFGIIDTVELNDSRENDGQGGLFTSQVVWNQIILDSFQAGYLRSLDFNLCMKFKHAISMRVYRFMGKRFHLKPDWTFELKDFAYEHIGLSRNYEGGTQIARKLKDALKELEAVGFLEPLSEDERFAKTGRDWSIRFIRKAPSPLPALDEPAGPPAAGQAAKLVARGVTARTADELVERHPAETIATKLEVFDWMTEKSDKRIAQNPAGYLVKSIQDDFATPKGFVSAAERQRRQELKQAKEQAEAAEQSRKQDSQAKSRREREEIAAFRKKLTPAELSEHEAAALAEADAETQASYATARPPLNRMLLANLTNERIRCILRDQSIEA